MDPLPRPASNWAGTTSSRRRTSTKPPPSRRASPAPKLAASRYGLSGRSRRRRRDYRASAGTNVGAIDRVVEEVFRREAGGVLATLIRLLGDFDLAEEARQEAFTAAIEQWAAAGVPANPRA